MNWRDKCSLIYFGEGCLAILKENYRIDGKRVIETDTVTEMVKLVDDAINTDNWVTVNGTHVELGMNGDVLTAGREFREKLAKGTDGLNSSKLKKAESNVTDLPKTPKSRFGTENGKGKDKTPKPTSKFEQKTFGTKITIPKDIEQFKKERERQKILEQATKEHHNTPSPAAREWLRNISPNYRMPLLLSANGKSTVPTPVTKDSKGNINGGFRTQRDKMYKDLKAKGDATYDVNTGKPVSFNNGYQVAFQTTDSEDSSKAGYLSDKEYDKKVQEICEQTGSRPYLGVFESPEISFHCETKEQAVDLMKQYNQHSIWDWEAGDIIENLDLDTSTNSVKQGE